MLVYQRVAIWECLQLLPGFLGDSTVTVILDPRLSHENIVKARLNSGFLPKQKEGLLGGP